MTKIILQRLSFVFWCALALLAASGSGLAQTTTFTYQGSLTMSGVLANGNYDLQFKLYDQLTSGTLQGSPNTVTVANVTVTGGVFTVELNFGASAFSGAARYLEIGVRPAGSGSYTTLAPRQQLTSTPYAIRSVSATSADTATTATSATTATTATNFSGSLAGDVTGTQSATTVALVGGVTASNVASGATAANNATSSNTPNTIVKRDASGNFSAGTITATLNGNASTATSATTATTATTATNATNFTGSLSGDVTGTQSATVVSTVGSVSASNVASGATAANNATDANTANAIVKRDASGNFSAGTISGSIVNTATQFNLGGSRILSSPGTGNLFVGANTGATNTTGSNNTLIGNGADVGAGNLTHATAIGAGATVSTNDTLVLGRAADTVQVPGNLTVSGTLTANISGNATTATNFTGSLAGDVTGTQSATVVSTVGSVTASNVASGAILANNATNSNTASTIVKRDASGNFSAGTITASLNGNASTATTATTATNFSGSLAGDVTGTQSATTVALVGGVSASNVASGATAANNATSSNTANAIVKRDAAGNFTAGTITASAFSGSGAGLTNLNASNITSGTLLDSLLSSNVATLSSDQTFTGNKIFSGANGLLATGTYGSGSILATGAGGRLMWYPKKAAFRAGYVSGTQWDDGNIGDYSIALGKDSTASNYHAVAIGESNTASGTNSGAFGASNSVGGIYSYALGKLNTVSSNDSAAVGESNIASGIHSFALGYSNIISNNDSVAIGVSNTASGIYSFAFGWSNTASGNQSLAFGSHANTNSKSGTFVFGDASASSDFNASANNQFNVRAAGGLRFFASSDTSDDTKPGLFISGTTGNTQINGNLAVSGTFSGSGASLTGLSASNISSGTLDDARLSSNVALLNATNVFTGSNTFNLGLSANNQRITNVATPTMASDAVNKSYVDSVASGAGFVQFAPASQQTTSSTNHLINLKLNGTGTLGTSGTNDLLSLSAAGTYSTGALDQEWFRVDNAGGVLAQGTYTYDGFNDTRGAGSIPATGDGARMMWYGGKAAFRAGYAFNGGWDDNNIGYSSFAGGVNNKVSGNYSVAFGADNNVTGAKSFAVGGNNTVTSIDGAAFGSQNTIGGNTCTALGSQNTIGTSGNSGCFTFGLLSIANASQAYAIGERANVVNSRAMVISLGPSFGVNTSDAGSGTFSVRAANGIWLGTNTGTASITSGHFIETSTGAYLTSGGTWTNSSDRNLKEGFAPVDGESLLRRLATVPMTTWKYRVEGQNVRHLGPMAQDFHAAFGLGDSDKTITTVDEGGVALAAAQALEARTSAQQSRMDALDRQMRAKDAEVEGLKQQVRQQQAMIDGMRKLLCSQNPQAEVCQK